MKTLRGKLAAPSGWANTSTEPPLVADGRRGGGGPDHARLRPVGAGVARGAGIVAGVVLHSTAAHVESGAGVGVARVVLQVAQPLEGPLGPEVRVREDLRLRRLPLGVAHGE